MIVAAEGGAQLFEDLIRGGKVDQLADRRQAAGLKAALEVSAVARHARAHPGAGGDADAVPGRQHVLLALRVREPVPKVTGTLTAAALDHRRMVARDERDHPLRQPRGLFACPCRAALPEPAGSDFWAKCPSTKINWSP